MFSLVGSVLSLVPLELQMTHNYTVNMEWGVVKISFFLPNVAVTLCSSRWRGEH